MAQALKVADPAAAFGAWIRYNVGDMLAPATNPTSGVTLPAVFRPDMPEWFDQNMPAAAVVIRPAGGYTAQFGKSFIPMADPRQDVLAYGQNQQQATQIARTILVMAKQLNNQIWENTLLYCVNISAGPTPLPDTQTLWPTCWFGVQLVHGELPVT